MYPGQERDIQPGISAVLLVGDDQCTELDGAVLDLAAVLDGLVGDNFEILVVGGQRSDRRTEIIDGLRTRVPRLQLRDLECQEPTGQVAAVAAGFDAAQRDLIFVTGADHQFDVRELNHLLDAIERGADLAIGYRQPRTDGLVRRVQGWGWNVLVNCVFGRTGRDVDCAFKLFRRSVWEGLDARQRGSMPTFGAELVIRARRRGFRVAEVPVSQHRPDRSIHTAASAFEMGQALRDLTALRRGLTKAHAASDQGGGMSVSAGRQVA